MNLLDLAKEMEYLHTHYLEIGILGDGGSVDGKQEETILKYGIINEFGSQKVEGRPPARAFMRNAIYSNSEAISKKIQEKIDEIMSGNLTGREAMMGIGLFIQGLVSKSIATASSWAVANATSTKKYKDKVSQNRNVPLILEGYLMKSIRFKIVDKNENLVYISEWSKFGG